ncbi:hypothetical protein RVR_3821 [Actinacidiphila reveromycinica]|uniref:Uncharacterized protein n=1 Tax=Actinacidiphila reveromycinica TaxID=659352 RepID=A0A7U3VNQ7_9ACTN|nr:hypothetical protein [Streptomyces sp. SN-593]BBA97869.1 hypothetical protein RVR_3821 [Streptomyces sp. SN-593]
MQVEIRAADDDGVPALLDFFRWLRDDDAGPEVVRLENAADGRPGAMGALEAVQVVLADATALASLAAQYGSWRRARTAGRRGVAFTFSRPSDGLSVTVDNGTDDEVRRIMAALVAPQEPPPSSEPPGGTPE